MEVMETLSESIGLPVWILVVVASAVVAWAITEVVKRSMMAYYAQHKDEQKQWWWNTIFRTVPLIVGSFMGWMLYSDAMWGWVIGFTGGAFCTTIVAIVKNRIKSFAEKKGSPDA